MSKAEERALEAFPLKEDGDSRGSYDLNVVKRIIYQQGYEQAEKDLLENKHEKSWRLDEKLWKSIKDIEEASYQYMYDVSNDWAYDFPIWENVQDAFKAGSEWNEGFKLTWEDLKLLQDISHEVFAEVANGSVDYYQIYPTEQSFLEEVLKRFKERKEKKKKT